MFPTHILAFNAYAWVLSSLEGVSLLPTHMLAVLRICVGSGAGWHVEGATLKGSGVGSAWMHAGQGNFPRICVGLLRLCVGVKLVRESGSRLNMSRRELERELVGQGGFPRICVDFPRLCVVRRGKGGHA
ncbi:hypothetical protein PIB30_079801 [Stylosanthes scabra]|uniref:Uncharacterized protein n=1 Tax=Stylosanthes scabra TaxID=79078 RepID=A0ABU6VRK3_9FABA|nr:hypothetical protein [Stylosanthes scabra]